MAVAAKTLPHNEDAEESVLGAILIDKDAVGTVSEIISSRDFYNGVNSIIYDAMLSLYEQSKPIDVVTLTSQLKKNKTYEKVKSAYLAELIESVPTAANVAHYANIIKETSIKRSLIRMGGDIAELAFSDDKEISEIIDKAEASVFSVSQGQNLKTFIPVSYTHLRAHETDSYLVCRLLLEKKK